MLCPPSSPAEYLLSARRLWPPALPSSPQGLFERIGETIEKEELCVTVEIVDPLLRKWVGLKPGQERFYDLRVREEKPWSTPLPSSHSPSMALLVLNPP